MFLSQDDHVIQAFAPDGAHQSFHKGILLRALGCSEDFRGAQVWELMTETFPIDLIPVSEQIAWRRVVGECFQDLLSGPSRGGMLRHVEMHNTPAMMRQHHEDEQHPKADRGHGEEVDRDQILDVVIQESPPSLSRGLPALGHQAGYRALGNLDSQFEQFALNARRTP